MKRSRTIGLSLSVVIMVGTLAVVAWWKIGGYYTVSVINIVNFQSRLQSSTDSGGLDLGGFSGAAWISSAVSEHKKRYPAALVAESGDLVMGPWWRYWSGEPEFAVSGLMGVQVGMLGNYEFNLGQDHLKKALAEYASFPILATNITFENQEMAALLEKTTILTTADGVKVGFFSLVRPQLVTMTRAGEGFSIEPDMVQAANGAVNELLNQGAQMVVMLSHSSLAEDLALAAMVDKVSLILTGDDCYDRQAALHWVNGPGGWPTAVGVCGGGGRNLPLFKLTMHRGRPVPDLSEVESVALSWNLSPDPEVARMVAGFENRMNDMLNRTVGSFTTSVNALKNYVRTGPAPLGDFIADAFRLGSGARLGLINAGDIRGGRIYPAGPVTDRTILEIMPFQNQILIKELTGREIRRLMEFSASALVGHDDEYDSAVRITPAGFLHVSGLMVTFSLKAGNKPALVDDEGRILSEGNRVKSLAVLEDRRWKPLDDDQVYTVAMPDFLGGGGDKYFFLADRPASGTHRLDSDLVIEHFMSQPGGKASLRLDGRMKIEGWRGR